MEVRIVIKKHDNRVYRCNVKHSIRHQSCCCSESKQWRTNIFRPAGMNWSGISRLLFVTVHNSVNISYDTTSQQLDRREKVVACNVSAWLQLRLVCYCRICVPAHIIRSDKYLRHIKILTDLTKRTTFEITSWRNTYMAKILFCVVKKIWAKNWATGQGWPGGSVSES